LPLLILEFIEFICLPIDSHYSPVDRVANSRHLEWKDIVFQLTISFAEAVGACIEEERFVGKLAMETADDQDFTCLRPGDFTDAAALTRSHKLLTRDLENLPLLLSLSEEIVGMEFKTLYRIHILLVLVRNATEDV
jgi:hypothetical protein